MRIIFKYHVFVDLRPDELTANMVEIHGLIESQNPQDCI